MSLIEEKTMHGRCREKGVSRHPAIGHGQRTWTFPRSSTKTVSLTSGFHSHETDSGLLSLMPLWVQVTTSVVICYSSCRKLIQCEFD